MGGHFIWRRLDNFNISDDQISDIYVFLLVFFHVSYRFVVVSDKINTPLYMQNAEMETNVLWFLLAVRHFAILAVNVQSGLQWLDS